MEYLINIFQSSILIAIFFIVYYILLRKDTYFRFKRFYFYSGLILSATLPWIYYTKTVFVEPAKEIPVSPKDYILPQTESFSTITQTPIETPVDWIGIMFYAYLFVTIAIVGWYTYRYVKLFMELQRSHSVTNHPFELHITDHDVEPFSFFGHIVLSESDYKSEHAEFILAHEETHVREWHSLDVLCINVACVLFWFNPFIWFYRRHMLQNLEHIADIEASKQSDKKEYQLLLLNRVLNTSDFQLAKNSLFQPSIKQRIMMLNKSKTPKLFSLKSLIVIPVLILFVLNFQIKINAQERKSDTVYTVVHSINYSENSIPGLNTSKKDPFDVSNYSNAPTFLDNQNFTTQNSGSIENIGIKKNNLNFYEKKPYSLNSKSIYIEFIELNGKTYDVEFLKSKSVVIFNYKYIGNNTLKGEGTILEKNEITEAEWMKTKSAHPNAFILEDYDILALSKNKEKLDLLQISADEDNNENSILSPSSKRDGVKDSASLNNGVVVVKIDKNSNLEYLETTKAILKKSYDIDVTYTDVKYNDNGELISINVEVDCNDGFKGNMAKSTPFPMTDMYIYRDYTERNSSPFGVGHISESKIEKMLSVEDGNINTVMITPEIIQKSKSNSILKAETVTKPDILKNVETYIINQKTYNLTELKRRILIVDSHELLNDKTVKIKGEFKDDLFNQDLDIGEEIELNDIEVIIFGTKDPIFSKMINAKVTKHLDVSKIDFDFSKLVPKSTKTEVNLSKIEDFIIHKQAYGTNALKNHKILLYDYDFKTENSLDIEGELISNNDFLKKLMSYGIINTDGKLNKPIEYIAYDDNNIPAIFELDEINILED